MAILIDGRIFLYNVEEGPAQANMQIEADGKPSVKISVGVTRKAYRSLNIQSQNCSA